MPTQSAVSASPRPAPIHFCSAKWMLQDLATQRPSFAAVRRSAARVSARGMRKSFEFGVGCAPRIPRPSTALERQTGRRRSGVGSRRRPSARSICGCSVITDLDALRPQPRGAAAAFSLRPKSARARALGRRVSRKCFGMKSGCASIGAASWRRRSGCRRRGSGFGGQPFGDKDVRARRSTTCQCSTRSGAAPTTDWPLTPSAGWVPHILSSGCACPGLRQRSPRGSPSPNASARSAGDRPHLFGRGMSRDIQATMADSHDRASPLRGHDCLVARALKSLRPRLRPPSSGPGPATAGRRGTGVRPVRRPPPDRRADVTGLPDFPRRLEGRAFQRAAKITASPDRRSRRP